MDDVHFMKLALQEAKKAMEEEEVPVGAVVVQEGAHAEMIALTAAFNAMGSKYLPEATLYVTVEPCPMCAGALYWSKIGRVVYGTSDEKNGYKRLVGTNWALHPQTKLSAGCCAEEAAQLMKDFFKARR